MRKLVLVGLLASMVAVGTAWGQQEEGLDFFFWNETHVAVTDSGGMRAIDAVSGDYFYGRWSVAVTIASGDSSRIDLFVMDGTTGAATCVKSTHMLRQMTITDFARADSIWATNTATSGALHIFVTGSKGDQSTWEGGRK